MTPIETTTAADEFEIRIKHLIKNIKEDLETPTIEVVRSIFNMNEIVFMYNVKRLIREGSITFDNGVLTAR